MEGKEAARVRLGGAAFGIAGLLFVLYPAIRPFSDETTLQGAAAFASAAWLLAHMLAMVGFTLVMLGLLGLYLALRKTPVEATAFWGLAVGLVAVGLLLPFYGAEAFGLHAIGQEALRQHSVVLVGLAGVVRSGPELIMFLVGLLLLAASAIMTAVAIWKSGTFAKWSGVPFAVGFALYIPQFFGNQPIRVLHGLLVAIGCWWIGAVMWQQAASQGTETS